MNKTITISLIRHRKKLVYALAFDYDKELMEICKSSGAIWSRTEKSWYYHKENTELNTLLRLFEKKAQIDLTTINNLTSSQSPILTIKEKLTKNQKEHLNTFYIYLRGKRFSSSTLTTYTTLIAEYIYNKDADQPIDLRSIETHSENVFVVKNKSISTHRQFISAMKHYLAFINSDLEIDFKYLAPKKDKKLPNVLSSEEIIELIRVTKNLKHRVCIALIYSSGLRVGELINLRLKNLDIERKMLKVQSGKGRKDRYVPIAEVMLPLLQNYLSTYTPKEFLVEGMNEGKQYSAISIRKFLKKSCFSANIQKHVTPHTLRHSYATHLLENGTDIRYIQTLLGHTRPETTMIYTHVQSQDLQKITNPLDLIVKQLEQRKKIN